MYNLYLKVHYNPHTLLIYMQPQGGFAIYLHANLPEAYDED